MGIGRQTASRTYNMKAWDKMWQKFDEMMTALPEAVDEFIEDTKNVSSCNWTLSIVSRDGDIAIRGKVNKLVINGYTIRLPKNVVEGK